MSEEKQFTPYRMRSSPEIRLNATPIIHRDDSIEHAYTVDISPDLPSVTLKVFIFPNGDARVEADFVYPHTLQGAPPSSCY